MLQQEGFFGEDIHYIPCTPLKWLVYHYRMKNNSCYSWGQRWLMTAIMIPTRVWELQYSLNKIFQEVCLENIPDKIWFH